MRRSAQVAEAVPEPLLIRRAQAGDRKAFSELVRLHQSVVRAYISSHVRGGEAADDLAQEVFVRAYVGLHDFEVPESGKSRPWLLGIARNLVLEHFRAQTRQQVRAGDLLEAALDLAHFEDARGKDEPLDRERQFQALQRCLEKLRTPSAELVTRHYFEQQSLASLAAEGRQKESALRMKLFRIREALRACIDHALPLRGARE
jgi:RNA polymerase sigma-70 factor (ECF subfamily)